MTSFNVTAEEVSNALAALGSPDKACKREINSWLEKFQKSVNAWNIVDQILRSDLFSVSDKIFASQTLRNKIMYDFHQLDSQTRIALRFSLFELLELFKCGPKVIKTQLCLSLADLAIQSEEWENVFHDMSQRYSQHPQLSSTLLEFLTVLPEEVDGNNRIPIMYEKLNQRAAVLLTANSHIMFNLIESYIQTAGNLDVVGACIRCLTSWLKSSELPPKFFLEGPLLDQIFSFISNSELFDDSIDFLCELIKQTGEVKDKMPMISLIFPKLVQLRPLLRNDADEEDLRALTRLFVEAGETYLPLIETHIDEFSPLLDGILTCTSFDDLDLVPITFNFWFQLAHEITNTNHSNYQLSCEKYFDSLVDIMVKHLHFPTDLQSWTAEEKDNFRSFRHNMGDVLKDCCKVLGTTKTLGKAFEKLNSALLRMANGNHVSWQEVEAPLFSFRAMGAATPDDEDVVIHKVMELIPSLPEHPKVRYAATLVIGCYSNWTKHHTSYIPTQLEYISRGFDDSEVAAAAAMALKYLCKECSKEVVGYLKDLYPFYIHSLRTMHPKDVLDITEALAHVVAVLPKTELDSALESLCQPIGETLSNILKEPLPSDDKNRISNLTDCVDRLAVYFRKVKPEIQYGQHHPCVHIFRNFWPLLVELLEKFSNIEAVSESVARCLKFFISSYKQHTFEVLPDIAMKISEYYDRTHHSCFIWVAKHIIKCFEGSEVSTLNNVQLMVEKLSSTTFSLFSDERSFVEMPEVIEDYFNLLRNMCRISPIIFVSSRMFPTIFECAVASLRVEQPAPLIAVLSFLDELFLSCSAKSSISPQVSPAILQIVEIYGRPLLDVMMKGVLFHFPRDTLFEVANTLKGLHTFYPFTSKNWIAQFLDSLPHDSITLEEKSTFLKQVEKSMMENDTKSLRYTLQEFSAVYRRRNYAVRQSLKAS